MPQSIIGARIRQRRRETGMTQAALAEAIGISASYLNLIELNKRRISSGLLNKVSSALDLAPGEFDVDSDRRLIETLQEIAHLPALAIHGIEIDRCSELIGRFPGWARAVAGLARAHRDAITQARTLSDRLSNDPYLSETVHRMLTRITAIRSAAEIVTEYPDLDSERRTRFDHIIREESDALTAVSEALASYLDKAEELNPLLTAIDEVEAFFESRDKRFEEIEAATAALAPAMDDTRPMSRRARAASLTGEALADLIAGIVAQSPLLQSAAARNRARSALHDYAVYAFLMPGAPFAERAARLAYDIEALAEDFSVEISAVCHRLTTLQGAPGLPRFGYFQANAAGTIVEMFGLKGLAVPRYSTLCSLWALFRAQQSPETVIRQRAVFPSGARFVFVARARHVGQTGFGKPRHYRTDMIAMTEADAGLTVYAPAASSPVEEIGPSCRLCPRLNCHHRVDDPLAG